MMAHKTLQLGLNMLRNKLLYKCQHSLNNLGRFRKKAYEQKQKSQSARAGKIIKYIIGVGCNTNPREGRRRAAWYLVGCNNSMQQSHIAHQNVNSATGEVRAKSVRSLMSLSLRETLVQNGAINACSFLTNEAHEGQPREIQEAN